MSRQLPTLRGRDLCVPDSPAVGTTDSLCLIVPAGAFWQAMGAALDTDVKSEPLCSVVLAGLSSLLLLLYAPEARLSLDRNSCCRVSGAESSSIVSSEQLLVWGFVETTVLRLEQLPPNWPSPPPFRAASRDWSFPLSTSLIGDSVSSHVPCLISDRRRHSVERNDVFAGGGTEGRSGFFRFPRWCAVGAVMYPQNTESRCRNTERGRGKSSAGRVSVQAGSKGEGHG